MDNPYNREKEGSMAERVAGEQATNGGGNGVPTKEFFDEWRNAAYNCFSSGHKFCREVCPVMQVTRDERHTPTAFHANVVAMEKGHLSLEDVADDYVHCTMCGACELRCPNTLFTGDFYRFRQRTIDVVKAVRAAAVEAGIHQESWRRWAELTDRWGNEPVLGWNIETGAAKVKPGRPGSTSRRAARRCSSRTARRPSSGRPSRGPPRSSCGERASSSG